jgi:hypothetical protein
VVETCSRCLDPLGDSGDMQLECKHAFHKSCLEADVENQLKNEVEASELRCPKGGCSYIVPKTELYRLLGSEFFKKYAEGPNSTIACPQCGKEVPIEGENGATKASAYCTGCGFLFCLVCHEDFKQNHDKRQCDFKALQDLVKTAESKAGPTEVVSQCPSCKFPNIFSKSSANVICQKSGCKTRFCVHCSVPTYLYTLHGNRYHRPNCKFFEISGRMETIRACKHCQELGRTCDSPKRLATPCRFSINES